MYETNAAARLAGAAALLVALAVWGLASVLAGGETTASTWALGLAVMFPVGALALGYASERPASALGAEYALGLVVAVATLSVAYLAALAVGFPPAAARPDVTALELGVAAVGSALLAVTLAVVDARYVERPATAARLEARYLDDPLGDD
ncbi:hypothetical protein [Halosimplex pelagicum]|uniref:Uncharacterized protein n=1 Tax=Halosimplex pelagicum TaxID=869886 RepID=A0A7D5PE96_9EURY|nr:hypothetical protein [Halosimplex pelagicum]QLH81880.1 hypothetical protein HZS54_09705 [Halosimplex pelagicum]